jgi:uncharacterized protein YoxC
MTPIQLSPVASIVLIGFYILSSLTLVALLLGLTLGLWKLNRLLEEYRLKIDPALEKANQVLSITAQRVDSIGGKAERILTQGEEITENVHSRVEKTATTVQKTVNAPLISVNSLAAGIGRGLATFAHLQNKEKRPVKLPVITEIAPPEAQAKSISKAKPVEDALQENIVRINQKEQERIPVGIGLPEKE